MGGPWRAQPRSVSWRRTRIRGAGLTQFCVQLMMRGMARTSAEPPPLPAGPGLFAALGGRPGVGLIVDGLYDRLERDRELARHFRSRRAGERERLKQFFETIFGGEVSGIRDVGVQRRHLHRLITASESARWLSHLGAAMQAAGAGQSAQAAVMDLFSKSGRAEAPRPAGAAGGAGASPRTTAAVAGAAAR